MVYFRNQTISPYVFQYKAGYWKCGVCPTHYQAVLNLKEWGFKANFHFSEVVFSQFTCNCKDRALPKLSLAKATQVHLCSQIKSICWVWYQSYTRSKCSFKSSPPPTFFPLFFFFPFCLPNVHSALFLKGLPPILPPTSSLLLGLHFSQNVKYSFLEQAKLKVKKSCHLSLQHSIKWE